MTMRFDGILYWALLAQLLVAITAIDFYDPSNGQVQMLRKHKHNIQAQNGAVATDDLVCSRIGRNVLKEGGHAVDAAVASAFCIGVVRPASSGIGGGTFMLISLANGTSEAYDMRETAPAMASLKLYAENITLKVKGPHSIGVLGELAGLHMAWLNYGKLPWKRLVMPAMHLARYGFTVGPYLSFQINSTKSDILADEGLRSVFSINGTLLRAGDRCHNQQLAKTLSAIARHGPKVLYNGRIGRDLVNDIKKAGGILSIKDLHNYRVSVTKPLISEIMGYKILGMPPPSSGAGVTLVLNILASYGTLSAVNGAVGTHRTIEAIKNMFAVRTNLGDPKFVNVTNILSDMLSPMFAAKLRKSINDNTTFEPEHYGDRWNLPDDHGTSHFCIADKDHNAVSMTSTINSYFGSTILSRSTGIILNNEMDDFSIPTKTVANVPPPAPANYIQPFKQPFSSMTPTIVLKDGKLKFLVGASGGKKIVVSTVVLLDLLFKKMDPLSAVRAPRVYHQLIPNVADYKNWTAVLGDHIEVKDEILEGLKKRGHKMQVVGVGSNIQLITVDDVPSHENQQPIHRLTAVSTCSPLSFKSCDQGNICSTLINTVCDKVKTMFYLLSTVQKESSLEFFRRFRLAYSNAPDVSFTMIPLAVVSLLVECAGLNLLFLTKLSRYFQLALLLLPDC